MTREKVCRDCHVILKKENICPVCKKRNLSSEWGGMAIIFDPKNSKIAKAMNVELAGRYALRVR
ncbi:MAG: transcription elongation factor subunit Spt4 [Candidatus Hydrothermarchaeota archaeon]